MKNVSSGYDCFDDQCDDGQFRRSIEQHEQNFVSSITAFQNKIKKSGMLVKFGEPVKISNKTDLLKKKKQEVNIVTIMKLVPFLAKSQVKKFFKGKDTYILTLDHLYELHEIYFHKHPQENYVIEGTGDLFDHFYDRESIRMVENEKHLTIDAYEFNLEKVYTRVRNYIGSDTSNVAICKLDSNEFSFDRQPNLDGHPGPSPSIILQALTMSNANDGINLERLETIGDSFLKYAITTYLYCTYEDVHEGKLSHLRSKQVSNLNLYRLGRKKVFGESMIATKFEPHDNWLPPCYYVPKELEKALIEAKIPACHWNLADLPNIKELTSEKICSLVKDKAEKLGLVDDQEYNDATSSSSWMTSLEDKFACFIPYNLVTQHSIPDKSVADCVEALIGAYLIECGQRGALLFMAWLGIRVLPYQEVLYDKKEPRKTGTTNPIYKDDKQLITTYGHWAAPKSPLLRHVRDADGTLEHILDGYSVFEDTIGYHFQDRSYLLQAMTHASYSNNRITDCYQRLEFLGDAVLDYLITRHLYEDPRQHSPGALTDLRSALVNNTIFASLAVRHGFHKYFRHLSPSLNDVIGRFVRIQHENGHSISEEVHF